MSALSSQLQALRRQAGVADEPLRSQLPASPIPEQLRKLLGIRVQLQSRSRAPDRELPGVEVAPGVRLLERSYPAAAAGDEIDARFANGRRGGGFAMVSRRSLLHFDTETTGLAGGTGTRAFMIGAATVVDDQLRVRQLFLSEMAGERAMLDCFSSWLDADTVLVSYNGRCYDAPLLATRFRLARLANPLQGLAHLDLLFPVRRRFREQWENCRLATAERRWLDLVREDDLPGSEAPRAWLDYLKGGSSRDLCRVIAHNDQDLRSLDALVVKLSGCQEPFWLKASGPRPIAQG